MLTREQTSILFLVRDLAQAPLSVAEQEGQVQQINEAILRLADEAEEARLLGNDIQSQEEFVILARRRLVEAQAASADLYDELRRTKVARITADDAADDLNESATGTQGVSSLDEDDEDIARGVRDAKSESITKVLQRMHDLAQAEVFKGELNISELDMSSKTLRELQEKYSSVDILLNGSRRLVKILDDADRSDRRMMQASLGFLAAVLAYIVYRRILSGPVKIMLWSLYQLVAAVRFVTPRRSAAVLNAPVSAGTAFAGDSGFSQPEHATPNLEQPQLVPEAEQNHLYDADSIAAADAMTDDNIGYYAVKATDDTVIEPADDLAHSEL